MPAAQPHRRRTPHALLATTAATQRQARRAARLETTRLRLGSRLGSGRQLEMAGWRGRVRRAARQRGTGARAGALRYAGPRSGRGRQAARRPSRRRALGRTHRNTRAAAAAVPSRPPRRRRPPGPCPWRLSLRSGATGAATTAQPLNRSTAHPPPRSLPRSGASGAAHTTQARSRPPFSICQRASSHRKRTLTATGLSPARTHKQHGHAGPAVDHQRLHGRQRRRLRGGSCRPYIHG
jgi:hypothetical protein